MQTKDIKNGIKLFSLIKNFIKENLFKEINSKKKTEQNKIIIQSQLNNLQEFVCEESSVINSSST